MAFDEELIRKFSELSNETAGEHFTLCDAIRLMVNLLFIENEEVLTGSKVRVSYLSKILPNESVRLSNHHDGTPVAR